MYLVRGTFCTPLLRLHPGHVTYTVTLQKLAQQRAQLDWQLSHSGHTKM